MVSSHRRSFAPVASLAIAACMAVAEDASAILVANYEFTNGSTASSDVDSGSAAGAWVPASLGMSGSLTNSGVSIGASPTFDGQAFMRGPVMPLATTTVSNINPASNLSFHEFNLTVSGLLPSEALNLTSIGYRHRADTAIRGWIEAYSDLTGYVDGNELGSSSNFSSGTNYSFSLASFGLLSGLTNGDSVNFRFYFSSTNSTATNNVQRLDNVFLNADVVTVAAIPEPAAMAFYSLLVGAGSALRRPRQSLVAIG